MSMKVYTLQVSFTFFSGKMGSYWGNISARNNVATIKCRENVNLSFIWQIIMSHISLASRFNSEISVFLLFSKFCIVSWDSSLIKRIFHSKLSMNILILRGSVTLFLQPAIKKKVYWFYEKKNARIWNYYPQ